MPGGYKDLDIYTNGGYMNYVRFMAGVMLLSVASTQLSIKAAEENPAVIIQVEEAVVSDANTTQAVVQDTKVAPAEVDSTVVVPASQSIGEQLANMVSAEQREAFVKKMQELYAQGVNKGKALYKQGANSTITLLDNIGLQYKQFIDKHPDALPFFVAGFVAKCIDTYGLFVNSCLSLGLIGLIVNDCVRGY